MLNVEQDGPNGPEPCVLVRGQGYIPARLEGWRPWDVTPRDAHILRLLRLGVTQQRIAERLGLGGSTVHRILSTLVKQAGVTDAAALYRLLCQAEWPERLPGRARTHLRVGADLWLTPRQADIVRHLIEGKTYKQIGAALNIVPSTVHNHLREVYKKFGVHNAHGLIGHVTLHGWPLVVQPERPTVRLYLPPAR